MPLGLGVPPSVVAVAAFLVGVALVVVCVEVFVEAIAESAVALGVSGFFLTVLLAGIDLENAVLGIAAIADGLAGVALGTVFGEALFILGAAVGLAGVAVPFETDVPGAYVAMMIASPGLLFALALDGTLSRADGAVLVVAFLPLVAAVYALESRTSTRYLAAEELTLEEPEADDGSPAGPNPDSGENAWPDIDLDLDLDLDLDEFEWYERLEARHGGRFKLAVALLAAVGMTAGSELAVSGVRELLAVLGVTGLAFGATVMSFVASLEELFLTVEPVRQGRPHLGVGNVVGSVLFFVTANAGLIALIGPIPTDGTVLTVHWPFFIVVLLLVAAVFVRGKIDRPSGALLLAVYVGYWGANYLPTL